MAFWRPGTIAPGSNVPVPKSSQLDREQEKDEDVAVYNPNSNVAIQKQRMMLPIYQHRTEILYLCEKYQVTVIVGETGCGKTTQIPQYLVESGWKKMICCTQPRRVAATSVATRVAQEMGVSLGREVGYSIRFDDTWDPNFTRIKYMTDGMLLRETMSDPLLSKYSVIMVDEAHERSLYTDILLGLLKKILKKRKDLRVIVASATIDAEDMKDFFNTNNTNDPEKDNVFIMSIEGRNFPVDIHYSMTPVSDYLQATLQTVLDIHKFQPEGDILVFLTGQEEIDTMVTLIREKATDPAFKSNARMMVLPMYSGLPHDKQMAVFQPAPRGTRKVIVATNIAETSVTIDGIVYVLDCGFVKIRAYNPRLAVETLVVIPISQATAKQRSGRAGRNRAGKSYRLYTEADYQKFTPLPVPEMQRTNLAHVVLQLKALGIDDVLHFDFMSSPPAENLIRALEILYSLGVLDDNCKLTEVGNILAEFPVDPYLAKMLISSGTQYKCSEEIMSIAAMLTVQSVFNTSKEMRNAVDSSKRKFAVYEGDTLTLLNVYNEFLRHKKSGDWCSQHHINYKAMLRVIEIRNQIKKYMRRWKIPIVSNRDHEVIRKCIVSGYFANAARLAPDGSYRTVRDNIELHLHPTSVLTNRNTEWLIYYEVVQTEKIYMREVTAVQASWLYEIAPHFYEMKTKAQKHKEAQVGEAESIAKRFKSVF